MNTNPLEFLEKFTQAGLEFVIVGGVALRLWGSTRLTHDIDIVPVISPKSWARTIDIIWDAGGRPRIPEPKERIANWENVTHWVREKNLLALIFRSNDQTAEIDLLVGLDIDVTGLIERAISIKVGESTYKVASIDDLISMKLKAGRPQDLLDVKELEAIQGRIA